MSNPGSTITITIEALTEQANAKLNAFFKGITTKVTASSLETGAALTQSAAGITAGIDKAAAQTTARIAGLTYYFRSAIDGIRVAAAGGGARAGFYAIDEAVRGLLASGLSLGTLAPVLAGLAVAVGGGAMVWNEYTSAEREAEKATKDLHDKIKGIADLMAQMKDMSKAGILSDEAVKRNMDILTGKIKLYKDIEGNITQSATSIAKASTQYYTGSSYYQPPAQQIAARTVANKPLEGTDLVKYLQDQLTVPGGNDPQENAAKAKLLELRDEIHAKAISDTELEVQKIHEKYQSERDEIDITAAQMGKLLTPSQREQNEKAKTESLANEQIEIAGKRQDAIDKINEQNFTARAKFARAANERLEADLTESAAKQGKSREEIYQEEYDKRAGLLVVLRALGILNEQQYTDAVKAAQAARLVGLNDEQAKRTQMQVEMDREMQEKARTAAADTLNNPGTSQGDKEKAMQSLVDLDSLMLDQNRTAIELANTDRERNELIRERLRLEQQYTNDQHQQSALEKGINDARVTGVRDMFGNMAAVAKSFGREGVAAYKAFAIAQATIDTARAAIGAYSSVVGIPYVGPVLAPIAAAAAVAAGAAQIAQIASTSSGYLEGGYTGSGPRNQVAGVVHRGEFVIPAERVRQYGLGMLLDIHSGRFSVTNVDTNSNAGGGSGAGGATVQHKTNLSLAMFGGEADAKRWAESQEGETWFLNQMDKHITKYQR